MMYHVADCVAAAIASKNKGVFMSSLTDLVFINVLPPFLPITISFHTSLPFPHYINSKRCFGDHAGFFCIYLPPSTHIHTHIHTVQGSCPTPVSAGASLKCAMYSPRVDEAHIRSHLTSSFSPPSHLHSGKG